MAWVAWTNSSPRRLFVLKWLRCERFMCYSETNEQEWGNYKWGRSCCVQILWYPAFWYIFFFAGRVKCNDNYCFISSHMFVSRIPGTHSPFKEVSSRISCRHMRRGRSVNSQAWDIVEISMERTGEIHGKHAHNQHGKDPWFDDGTWWNIIESPIKHQKLCFRYCRPFNSTKARAAVSWWTYLVWRLRCCVKVMDVRWLGWRNLPNLTFIHFISISLPGNSPCFFLQPQYTFIIIHVQMCRRCLGQPQLATSGFFKVDTLVWS